LQVGADQGKFVMEPSSTPSSSQEVYPIVFVKTKYVALLSFCGEYNFYFDTILLRINYVTGYSSAINRHIHRYGCE